MLSDIKIRKLADTLNAHPDVWAEVKAFMRDAVKEANDETTAESPGPASRDYYAGYEQGQKDTLDSLQKLKDRDATAFPQLIVRDEGEGKEEDED